MPRPTRDHSANELVPSQALRQPLSSVLAELFHVPDETLDLSQPRDRSVAWNDLAGIQLQDSSQGADLPLNVSVFQVRMIAHPENVAGKEHTIRSHEKHRVTIGMSAGLGVNDVNAQFLI